MNYLFVKSVLDRVFALLFFICVVPLLSLIATAIYFETGKNPFFIQQRSLSYGKKYFTIVKFRTLKECGDLQKKNDNNFLLNTNITQSVIRVGKYLRKSGLDELPQLINIIKGEMSFVGPRPLAIEDLEIIKKKFNVFHCERKKMRVKPGLTGFWQLYGNREKGIDELRSFDNRYAEECSFKTDVIVILKTIPIILFAVHSDSIFFEKINQKKKTSLMGKKYLAVKQLHSRTTIFKKNITI